MHPAWGTPLVCVKLKLFVRIRQQNIFSCVYEFIVTSGQLFPVHGELNNTVLSKVFCCVITLLNAVL